MDDGGTTRPGAARRCGRTARRPRCAAAPAGQAARAGSRRLRPRQPTGSCPHCAGLTLVRFGHTPRGAQRWHCKGCGRKHQATTGTIFAGVHRPDKLQALVDDMLGPAPSSCRRLARRLALDKSTVWQWRQKACRGFAAAATAPPAEPIETDVLIVRESRKASREWVNHARAPALHPAPDRLRWVDYRRRGLAAPDHLPRYRIPVIIAVDDADCCVATVRIARERSDDPIRRSSALLFGSVQAITRSPAPDAAGLAATALESIDQGPYRGGMVDRAVRACREFLRPFRGPATRHLPAYVAWFVVRGDGREPAPWRTHFLRDLPPRVAAEDRATRCAAQLPAIRPPSPSGCWGASSNWHSPDRPGARSARPASPAPAAPS